MVCSKAVFRLTTSGEFQQLDQGHGSLPHQSSRRPVSSGRRIDVDSNSWLAGRWIVLSVTRSTRTNTGLPLQRYNGANSSVRRPCHIQHHEFRRNAPSQWHATRPNAAGHIEILSSLPNKPLGRACAYPSSIKATTAKHTSIARPTGWPQ